MSIPTNSRVDSINLYKITSFYLVWENIFVQLRGRCVTRAPVDFCNNLNQMRTELTQTGSPIK
jgi:hypothetical protein